MVLTAAGISEPQSFAELLKLTGAGMLALENMADIRKGEYPFGVHV